MYFNVGYCLSVDYSEAISRLTDVDCFLASGVRHQVNLPAMATALLLLLSAFLCFALFYKAIDWFERI